MSQPTPSPRGEGPKAFRLDPAALPIAVAGLVLVGAVLWLLGRPMPEPAPAPDAGLAARIAALEARPAPELPPPAPNLAPLTARLVALEARPAAATDLGPLAARIAALEGRPAPVIPPATDLGPLTARLAAAEATLAQRAAAAEAQAGRLTALEAALAQRTAAAEAQAARLTALEAMAQRLTALEARAARLAALETLRANLEAGRPLGAGLAALPNAPAALARFATAAPTTEAALRLGFEDAARAGRAASDGARDGASTLDAALSRLGNMVTIRRGEDVVWGDAALAEIERARRAVEAGDLEGALARLARLSPPAKEAMKAWIGDAEALVAARAALRALAAG
jgi:hypothetical protein